MQAFNGVNIIRYVQQKNNTHNIYMDVIEEFVMVRISRFYLKLCVSIKIVSQAQ